MLKHAKKILLGILALLVLGFFAERALLNSAAASLAESTPELVPHRALVMPHRGTVEIRKAGSEAWIAITAETQVEKGDAVRTGAGASASLNLFEQGVARLDENATITLEDLAWDQEKNSFVGKILLESGRLWSRLLDFMAPESAYEVRTPHLVATVRGTAFFVDASAAANDVYVAEHLVRVAPASGGDAADVAAGKKLRLIVPQAGATARLNASAWKIEDAKELSEDAWVRGNLEMDVSFRKRVEERLQGDLERFVPRPDMSVRVEAKERSAIAKHPPNAQRIATREMTRLAAETLLVASFSGGERGAVATLDRAEQFCAYVRRSGLECRIHPRVIEYVSHHRELTPLLRDVALRVSPDLAETLHRVLDRRATFEAAPPAVLEAATDAASDAAFEIRVDGLPTPTPVSVPSTPLPQRLEVSGERFTFGFGESGSFSAFLRWSDGRTEDVTKDVVWSLGASATPIGQMRGNLFTAMERAGETKLIASYTHALGIFTGTDTLRVVQPDLPIIN
ncbi:MAG: FecR family protein [Patescibacteria group bacterium]|nr:MAG: FecR family protein [Patescibacteria group bacterium]